MGHKTVTKNHIVKTTVEGDKLPVVDRKGRQVYLYTRDYFASPYIINLINSIVSGGSVTSDATLTGDGSGGSPLGVTNPFPGFTSLTVDYGITLATVATSGDYNDLSNLPTIETSSGTDQVQFSDGAGGFNTHAIQWEASNNSMSPTTSGVISMGGSGRLFATMSAFKFVAQSGIANGFRFTGSGVSAQITSTPGLADGLTLWSDSSNRKMNIASGRGSIITDGALGSTQEANDDVTLELVGNSVLRLAGATSTILTGISTPLEGMITRATTTDAIFTSTGLWTYENGAWRKVEPVSTETFSSSAESNTSAPHTNWVNKISVNTSSLVAGNYKITLNYGWNHNATNSDFESRLSFDGTILGDVFGNGTTDKIEPKDAASPGGGGGSSGSSQQLSTSRTFILTGIAAGVKAIVFDFRSDDASDLSTVWDVSIEIERIP